MQAHKQNEKLIIKSKRRENIEILLAVAVLMMDDSKSNWNCKLFSISDDFSWDPLNLMLVNEFIS